MGCFNVPGLARGARVARVAHGMFAGFSPVVVKRYVWSYGEVSRVPKRRPTSQLAAARMNARAA